MTDEQGHPLTAEAIAARAAAARPSRRLVNAIVDRYENRRRKQVLRALRSGDVIPWRWQRRYRGLAG